MITQGKSLKHQRVSPELQATTSFTQLQGCGWLNDHSCLCFLQSWKDFNQRIKTLSCLASSSFQHHYSPENYSSLVCLLYPRKNFCRISGRGEDGKAPEQLTLPQLYTQHAADLFLQCDQRFSYQRDAGCSMVSLHLHLTVLNLCRQNFQFLRTGFTYWAAL